MRETEIQKVTETKVVIIGVKCDECGKKIVGHYWRLYRSNTYSDCDIDYDLCSKECGHKMLESYFEDCKKFTSERFSLSEAYFKGKDEGV